jgi:hypothetical protein
VLVDEHFNIRLGVDERALVGHFKGLLLEPRSESANCLRHLFKGGLDEVNPALLDVLEPFEVRAVDKLECLYLVVSALDRCLETLAGYLGLVLHCYAAFVDPGDFVVWDVAPGVCLHRFLHLNVMLVGFFLQEEVPVSSLHLLG